MLVCCEKLFTQFTHDGSNDYLVGCFCLLFVFSLYHSLDNSEWMRNGDFGPSRLISQNDAAILLSTRKIDQNAESAVAVISMAGKG